MDYNQYNPTTPYPCRPEKPFLRKEDRDNSSALRKYLTLLEAYEESMVEWRKKDEVYRGERYALEIEFKKNALDVCGILNHPKADKAYSLAYEDGHSEGFGGIYNALIKYAELLTD